MLEEKKYQTAHVNEPKKVLKFLIKYLDFFDHAGIKQEYEGKQGMTVSNKFGNDYLLISRSSSTGANLRSDDIIIFNTDNCLRDYHKLRSMGIKIEQVPRYTTKGLELTIADDYGNQYILMEERDYSEI